MKRIPYCICLLCFLLSIVAHLKPQQTSGSYIRTNPYKKECNKLLAKLIFDIASMLTLTPTSCRPHKLYRFAYIIPVQGAEWSRGHACLLASLYIPRLGTSFSLQPICNSSPVSMLPTCCHGQYSLFRFSPEIFDRQRPQLLNYRTQSIDSSLFAAQTIIIAQDWQFLSISIPRGHKIATRLPHSHPVLIFRKECLWPLLQSSNLTRRRILELHASLTMSMPRSVPRLVAAPPMGGQHGLGLGMGIGT